MKKISKMLALSLAMALTFGLTVSAAGSTSTTDSNVTNETLANQAEEVKKDAAAKVNETGASVTVTVEAATVETFDSAAAYAKAVAKTLTKNEGTATVLSTFILSVDVKDQPITITVKVPGVKADGKYAFLHYDEEAKNWETVAAVNNNGALTGTFKSLSPVAVVELKDGEEPAQGNNNSGSEAAPAPASESPKTGEAVPVAGVLAVMLAVCAIICAKKYEMSK